VAATPGQEHDTAELERDLIACDLDEDRRALAMAIAPALSAGIGRPATSDDLCSVIDCLHDQDLLAKPLEMLGTRLFKPGRIIDLWRVVRQDAERPSIDQ